jgi:hypothetical protein
LYGLSRSLLPSGRQAVYANKKPAGNPKTVKIKKDANFSVQEGTPSIGRMQITVNNTTTP